jgi:hypothetical protein
MGWSSRQEREMAARCEYPGCIAPVTQWCHASCCSGETGFCEAHAHDAQTILDRLGYPSGTLGEHHEDALKIVKSLRSGWKSLD